MSRSAGESATLPARTRRQEGKDRRRRDLLDAAGRLFGTHGYASVALDDIGSEAGVSGQAIYRHFKGKQDMLGRLLVEISESLLQGGRRLRDEVDDASARLDRLIAFQVDFALSSPEVIRVQDQEMSRLLDADRRTVRRMQREYAEVWVASVAVLHPGATTEQLRIRVHAVFGLINSTAHSMKHLHGRPPSAETVAESAVVLAAMARAAIDCRIDGQ